MISAGGAAVGRRPSIFLLLHQAAKAQRLAAWRHLEKILGGDIRGLGGNAWRLGGPEPGRLMIGDWMARGLGGDVRGWTEAREAREARKAPEGGTPEGLRKRNSDEPGRGCGAGGRNSHEFSCAQANFSVR